MRGRTIAGFLLGLVAGAVVGCSGPAPPATGPGAAAPPAPAPAPTGPPPAPGHVPASPPPPAPAPHVSPDGRVQVSAADLKTPPYCYVGRLNTDLIPNDNGTAVLIGPRHILTAAHVVLDLEAYENKGWGVPTFTLPDGRTSTLGDAELDGGWRYKLISCDFALVVLDNALGAGGKHAEWAAFDDAAHPGKTMHVTGYDGDLWKRMGKPAPYPLFDRTVTVADLKLHREVVLGGAVAGGVLVSAVPAPKSRYLAPVFKAGVGLGVLGAAGAFLLAKEADRAGWVGKGGHQAQGVSGGPLWYDDGPDTSGKFVPKVVGVAGHAFSVTFPGVTGAWWPIGSKIAADFSADMVRNFIATHP